jgi:hypothetical protein
LLVLEKRLALNVGAKDILLVVACRIRHDALEQILVPSRNIVEMKTVARGVARCQEKIAPI